MYANKKRVPSQGYPPLVHAVFSILIVLLHKEPLLRIVTGSKIGLLHHGCVAGDA